MEKAVTNVFLSLPVKKKRKKEEKGVDIGENRRYISIA
jgi:hypothetical protein